MTPYPRVVLEVAQVCYRCEMILPAGALVYYQQTDGKFEYRHINCKKPTEHESRNRVRRKADYHEVMARIESEKQ